MVIVYPPDWLLRVLPWAVVIGVAAGVLRGVRTVVIGLVWGTEVRSVCRGVVDTGVLRTVRMGVLLRNVRGVCEALTVIVRVTV